LQEIITSSPLPVIARHLGYAAENKDEPEVVIYYIGFLQYPGYSDATPYDGSLFMT